MDAEAAVLLTTAGTTVVGLMATDAWNQTHDGLVQLWHRFRPEHAAEVGRDLASSRAAIAAAQGGDTSPEAGLSPLWAQELRELLADPQAARALSELLHACTRAADSASAPQKQRVEAKAKGHGRSYAAGRDMTINEAPGDGS